MPAIHEIPKVLDELVVNLMAKSPTDRPWDAAAVGMKLSELREKVNTGAHIADGLAQASRRREIRPQRIQGSRGCCR